MSSQIIPLLAPRGGLNHGLPADLISEMQMSDCRNVFFQEGLVKKRYGYSSFGSNLPLPGVTIGNDQFYLFSGTNYLLNITTKLPFKLMGSGTTAYWETIGVTEEEDDCETTWTGATNVTVADETTIKKVDSKSQKISPAAAFSTGLLAYHDQSLGDKSAYSFVRFWIRSSVAQAAGDLTFEIDNTAGCGSPTETLSLPALVKDTWKLVFLECDDPSSNMKSIESLGISAVTDNGACNIYIDDIQFVTAFSSDVAYDADNEDFVYFDYIRKTTETEPWWVMTNGVDPIKKWTGTGSISNLISTYPSGVTALLANILIEFKGHLFLIDVSEDGNRYPQRVRWSNTAQPEDFLNGNASFQDLKGADWAKGAIKFKGDYLVVIKDRSIWVGYATGDSDVFVFEQKITGAGCAAGKTIEDLGDEIIFLGWDDVYIFDGINYESIAENDALNIHVREKIFDNLNPEQIGKSFGVIIESQKEYWLFVPSTSATYCDTAWCFNYDLNTWTRHELDDVMVTFGYYEKQAQLTIGDLVGTIGEQTFRIGSQATSQSAPTTLLADTSGYVWEYDTLTNNDNGTAIDGWFSTKDFNPTNLMQRFCMTRIDIYYTGHGLDISYSLDKGATWTAIDSLGASDDLYTPQSVYLKIDCIMCRLRFRNNTAGQHFEFSRANIFWEPSGGRL